METLIFSASQKYDAEFEFDHPEFLHLDFHHKSGHSPRSLMVTE